MTAAARPLHAHGRCGPCDRRWRREAAKRPCPRCGRPGLLRPDTGICGRCQRALRPRQPPAPPRQEDLRALRRAPARTRHAAAALAATRATRRWWTTAPPGLPRTWSIRPDWLAAFAGYLAGRLSPGRGGRAAPPARRASWASGEQLAGRGAGRRPPGPASVPAGRWPGRWKPSSPLPGSPCHPTPPRRPPRSAGHAGRRERRQRSGPPPRPSTSPSSQARDRARRAGTRPRADRTLEINLGRGS